MSSLLKYSITAGAVALLLSMSAYGASEAQLNESALDVVELQIKQSGVLQQLGIESIEKLGETNGPGFRGVIKSTRDTVIIFPGTGVKGGVWNAALLMGSHTIGEVFSVNHGIVILSEESNSSSHIPAQLQLAIASYGDMPKSFGDNVMFFAQADLSGSPLTRDMASLLKLDNVQLIQGSVEIGEVEPLWGGSGGMRGYSVSVKTDKWGIVGLEALVTGRELSLTLRSVNGVVSYESDLGLVFQFPKEMGGQAVNVSGIMSHDSGGILFDLEGVDTTGIKSCLGVPWLSLAHPAFNIHIDGNEISVAITGKVHGKTVHGLLDIQSGAIKDFRISLIDPIKGSELPGVKLLPGADSLQIKNPVLGKGLVMGEVKFLGADVDFAAIDMGGGNWGGHFDLKNPVTLASLTGIDDQFLKSISLSPPKILVLPKSIDMPWDAVPIGAIPVLTSKVNAPKENKEIKDSVYNDSVHVDTTQNKSVNHVSASDFNRSLLPPKGNIHLPAGLNLRGLIDPSLLPDELKSVTTMFGLKTPHKIQGYFSTSEMLIQDTLFNIPTSFWLFKGDGNKGPVWNSALMQQGITFVNTLHFNKSIMIFSPDTNTVKTLPQFLEQSYSEFGELSNTLTNAVSIGATVDIHNSPSQLFKSLAQKLSLPQQMSLSGSLTKGCVASGSDSSKTNSCSYDVTLNAEHWGVPGLENIINGKDFSLDVKSNNGVFEIDGTVDLDIKLPAAMGGVSMALSGAINIENLGTDSVRYIFNLEEQNKQPWNNVMGVNGLTMANVGVTISLSTQEQDFIIHGDIDGKEVDVELDIAQGAVVDYSIELKGKYKLSDLPMLDLIPGASFISITDPVLGKRVIKGTVDVKGMFEADIIAFETSPGGKWGAHLSITEQLTLGDIIGAPEGLAGQIHIPSPDFMLLPEALNVSASALPDIVVQEVFTAGSSTPAVGKSEGLSKKSGGFASSNFGGQITMPEGLNIGGVFDPSILPEEVQKSLKIFGLETPLPLEGTLMGLFGGEPGIAIKAILSQPAIKLFPFMQQEPSAQESFFIRFQGEMFELGIETSIMLPGAKDQPPLIFDVDFALKQDAEVIEVLVSGDMRGDWNDALGIKGLILENPLMSVGINETGGFDFLLDGIFIMGDERVRLTGDLVILPEGGFVPEALALAGEISVIDIEKIAEAGEALVMAAQGKGMKGGGLSGLAVKFKNLKFAVMTPGSTLPPDLEQELHLEGAGFALAGELWINDALAGSISGFSSELGMGFDGLVPHLKIGPLELKNMGLDVHASIDQDPLFAMKGEMEFFPGYKEAYDFMLSPQAFHFMMDTKWGGLFEARIEAVTTRGLQITPDNDLEFEAELKGDYNQMFRGTLESSIDALKQVDQGLEVAQNAVAQAQRQVDSRSGELTRAKQAAQKKVDKELAGLKKAEDDVKKLRYAISKLKKDIKSYTKKANKAAKKWDVKKVAQYEWKIGKLKTELAGVQTAKSTAEYVLKNVQQSVKAVGVDTDPQVVLLTGELTTEQGALIAAQATLKGIQQGDEALLASAQALDDIIKIVDVQDIVVSGSLAGIISKGSTGKIPTLKLTFKIQGQTFSYTVALGGQHGSMGDILNKISKQAMPDLLKLVGHT